MKPEFPPSAKTPAASPALPCGFAFAPTAVPQGDGSILIKAGKPQLKLTVRQAAQIAGCGIYSIYRLFDAGLIEGYRPCPRKIVIYAESLERHLANVHDPEFWDRAKPQTHGIVTGRPDAKNPNPKFAPGRAKAPARTKTWATRQSGCITLQYAQMGLKGGAASEANPFAKPISKE